jgi:hypothetical protein
MNAVTWGTLAVLVSLIGLASVDSAQAQPSGLTVRGVVEGDVVEGRVSRVDPRTRTLTLDNGQEYVVPPVLAPTGELPQPGTDVKLRFSVDAGRNIATLLEPRQ